jgi:hypothetical protein
MGLFSQDAKSIVESLSSPSLFPDGPAAGMRLLTFYMTHAGTRLSVSRRRSLEKARKLLLVRVEQKLKQDARRAA